MEITKLTSTDAFVVVDLAGAERSSGIARWAKKVLQDGANNLARHLTYGYAALGIEASGASAGINSLPDDRSAAIEAFVTEAPGTGVRFDPGKGLTADDLVTLAGNRSAFDRTSRLRPFRRCSPVPARPFAPGCSRRLRLN